MSMYERKFFTKSIILTVGILVILGVILSVPKLRSIFKATALGTGSYVAKLLPFNKLSISERQQLTEENTLLQFQS